MVAEHYPQLAANLLIVAWAALETRRWREGGRDRRLARPASSRGTAAVLIGCYIVALLALNWAEPAFLPLPLWARWLGIALGVAGLALHARCLRPFAARTPAHRGRQRVVVRYLAYLGNLAIWSGATMASGNSVALLTVALAMLAAYAVRISAEAALLER